MFFNAWFVPYQKSSFSAIAFAEFALQHAGVGVVEDHRLRGLGVEAVDDHAHVERADRDRLLGGGDAQARRRGLIDAADHVDRERRSWD